LDPDPFIWILIHSFGSWSIHLDPDPFIWILIHSFGSRSIILDPDSNSWIPIQTNGSDSNDWSWSIQINSIRPWDWFRTRAKTGSTRCFHFRWRSPKRICDNNKLNNKLNKFSNQPSHYPHGSSSLV
jgi:hypothetical protein